MIRVTALVPLLLGGILIAGCEEAEEDFMVGTLERDRIELRVESSEPVLAIRVDDGAEVQAGDAIIEQDPSRHQARLQLAQAQYAQAAARLAELRRGPREEAIREAQARLQASEAITANAKADLQRVRDMFGRGLSDQATLDNATARWQSAQANENAVREILTSLLNGTTVEQLQQAQAALEAAEAVVRQAEIDLARLRTEAPVAAIVDKVLYEIGERPAPGATVAVLLDSQRSYARIYVPEYLRAQIVPGTALAIEPDGAGRTLRGTVRWVSLDASFTPYFALTEHDRSRLSYLAEVDIEGAADLPSGLPLRASRPTGEMH